jgi:hypothetical protein
VVPAKQAAKAVDISRFGRSWGWGGMTVPALGNNRPTGTAVGLAGVELALGLSWVGMDAGAYRRGGTGIGYRYSNQNSAKMAIENEAPVALARSPIQNGQSSPFKKGRRKVGGRQKGTPNKSTRNIRDAMTESAVKHGLDGNGTGGLTGFCQWLLKNDLKAWAHIFGKLVPLQVAAEVAHHHRTLAVNVISIPRGRFFTTDEVAAVMRGELPTTIDLTPTPIADEPATQDDAAAPDAAPVHGIIPSTPEQARILAELEQLSDEQLEARLAQQN